MIKLNKKRNPKVLLCIFGFIMIVLGSLVIVKMTKSKEITKTYLNSRNPFFQADPSGLAREDTVAVIDYKNYSLYEFSNFSSFSYKSITHKSITFKTTITHSYFLLKKKKLYGYYYESLDDTIGKRVRMDSLLSKRAYYNQCLFVSLEGMELIESQKKIKGYELIEKYKYKATDNCIYPDTVIIYYDDKLKNSSFTLSKILDSVKKMKVQKIRAIFKSQFIKGNPNKFPACEFKFELKEDTISNLEKYKRFIDEKIKAGQ